jgi:RNA polymerase sigma factor (sigma-70 family)
MVSQTFAAAGPPARDLLALSTASQSDRELLERFVRQRDEVAFEALVQRHGAMVLSVCQRILNHAQDAEDAFQATFLVFMRKAHTLGKPELLGNWLYGVAFRIARKARAQANRRRHTEREAVPMASADPLVEAAWRDFRALLDDELQRLPARYRAPLVLCYLEGLTNEEAARRLGWPSGSMSYRLARGRELLRDRLAARHPALPAALFSTYLAGVGTMIPLPLRLVDPLVNAATGAPSAAAAGSITSAATALAEQTLQGMATARRWGVTLVAALVTALALASGTFAYAALTGNLPGMQDSSQSSGSGNGSGSGGGGGCCKAP